MLTHTGAERTFSHNLRLAIFLSFTAGLVNICGVLALGVLTTNVTGHFAYFAEAALQTKDFAGIQFLFYILAFLAGSFASSLLTEYCIKKQFKAPHGSALILEIIILLIVGIFGETFLYHGISKPLFACILLFTMGLQNSMVSRISDSAVRTTHLTGLFTDLGIELSQLFFWKTPEERKQLLLSISLRGGIIGFFFLGCMLGGLLYSFIGLKLLVVAAIILIIAGSFDRLLEKYQR